MGLDGDLGELSRPEKISAAHDIEHFDCGNSQLDEWLKRRALKNEAAGASRTYVLCAGKDKDENKKAIAYYCLANGAVALTAATGRVRRNMPDPIPIMVIGRLAVDRRWQGKGLGRALLRDAILRILQAAEIAGIRAILVHAISEDAKQFYQQHGFVVSLLDSMTLMLKVSDAMQTDVWVS